MSRRFVKATETALTELLSADLSGLDLVALMLDGVHFGEPSCVVALGIGIDGTKHPLALEEGHRKRHLGHRSLLVGLRERGLDITSPVLVVLDGVGGAAGRGARTRSTTPVIASAVSSTSSGMCWTALPETSADARSSSGCARPTRPSPPWPPQAQLEALATELDKTHPGAAAACARDWTRP